MIRSYTSLRRALTLCAALASAAVLGQAHAGGAPPSPASPCASGTVCDSTLGLALTPPSRWITVPPGKFPAGTLAFWTLTPNTQEPALHLVIDSIGSTQACGDAQATATAARVISRAAPYFHGPIMRRRLTVGGAPAIAIIGLPGSATYGLTIVITHHGLLYRMDTFGSKALTVSQQQALSSMRFIPRNGPFPRPTTPAMARALRACATAMGSLST